MFEEISAPFEVGVTYTGEIIIGVGEVWQAFISAEGCREIAANLYTAAAEAQSIVNARNN